jgi:hypothetical protein
MPSEREREREREMSHDVSRKSELPISGLFLCLVAAMAAIGLLLVANNIEEPKQTAKVFVPVALSQTTR